MSSDNAIALSDIPLWDVWKSMSQSPLTPVINLTLVFVNFILVGKLSRADRKFKSQFEYKVKLIYWTREWTLLFHANISSETAKASDAATVGSI